VTDEGLDPTAAAPAPPTAPDRRAHPGLWVALALGLCLRLFGFAEPWSGLASDFHSHFGAFATGGPASNFAEHGFESGRGLPYDWRLERADGSFEHAFYAHHPALYMWLSGASLALFGNEPWALRLPALLLSLASILALERLVRELSGPRTAALAALFLAVLPFAVRYGIQPWTEGALVGTTSLVALEYLRWLRGGGVRHLRRGALWVAAGGLLDWPAHFLLPALGLHAALVCAHRGGWRRLWPTLWLPAGTLATVALHALHMAWAMGLSDGSADKANTLAGVTQLPEGLTVAAFLGRQVSNLVRYTSPPLAVLLAVGLAAQLVRLGRPAGRAEQGLRLALLTPGLWYVGLFPGRSHNHDFFLMVSLPWMALTLAELWIAAEAWLERRSGGRVGGPLASLGLLVLAATAIYGSVREWAIHRSTALQQFTAEPWLAEWISDPRAVLLTHMGRGMALPFAARAQIVHSVDSAARLRGLLEGPLAELAPGYRVAYLVDLQWAAGLADFPALQAELARFGAPQLHEGPLGTFGLVPLPSGR
jgi:hypothetical protein